MAGSKSKLCTHKENVPDREHGAESHLATVEEKEQYSIELKAEVQAADDKAADLEKQAKDAR